MTKEEAEFYHDLAGTLREKILVIMERSHATLRPMMEEVQMAIVCDNLMWAMCASEILAGMGGIERRPRPPGTPSFLQISPAAAAAADEMRRTGAGMMTEIAKPIVEQPKEPQ